MNQFGKLLGTLIRHKLHYERWTLFSSTLGSIAYAEVSRDFKWVMQRVLTTKSQTKFTRLDPWRWCYNHSFSNIMIDIYIYMLCYNIMVLLEFSLLGLARVPYKKKSNKKSNHAPTQRDAPALYRLEDGNDSLRVSTPDMLVVPSQDYKLRHLAAIPLRTWLVRHSLLTMKAIRYRALVWILKLTRNNHCERVLISSDQELFVGFHMYSNFK